jgi:hypothetical protein
MLIENVFPVYFASIHRSIIEVVLIIIGKMSTTIVGENKGRKLVVLLAGSLDIGEIHLFQSHRLIGREIGRIDGELAVLE